MVRHARRRCLAQHHRAEAGGADLEPRGRPPEGEPAPLADARCDGQRDERFRARGGRPSYGEFRGVPGGVGDDRRTATLLVLPPAGASGPAVPEDRGRCGFPPPACGRILSGPVPRASPMRPGAAPVRGRSSWRGEACRSTSPSWKGRRWWRWPAWRTGKPPTRNPTSISSRSSGTASGRS